MARAAGWGSGSTARMSTGRAAPNGSPAAGAPPLRRDWRRCRSDQPIVVDRPSPGRSSADDLFRLEEEGDLGRRVLVAVGAMDRVGLDRFGKGFADRALGGIGRIG